MRIALAAGLATCIALGAHSAQAELPASAALAPDVLMKSVTTEVTAILTRDAAAGKVTDIAQLVETRILPLFDFTRMTRIAVGRNWALASPEQQGALVTQFTALLVRSYSSVLSSYRDEEIRYLPLRAKAGDTEVLVRSAVRRSGTEPLTIDYEMQDTPAGWKVYDIKVVGVSLIANYRETFAAAVRAGGIDGLVKMLAEKNRANQPDPRTGLLPVLLLPLVHGRI